MALAKIIQYFLVFFYIDDFNSFSLPSRSLCIFFHFSRWLYPRFPDEIIRYKFSQILYLPFTYKFICTLIHLLSFLFTSAKESVLHSAYRELLFHVNLTPLLNPYSLLYFQNHLFSYFLLKNAELLPSFAKCLPSTIHFLPLGQLFSCFHNLTE